MDPKGGARVCNEIREARGQLTPADLKVTSIPKAGHYPFLDQPDLFMKALLEQTKPYRWDALCEHSRLTHSHLTCMSQAFYCDILLEASQSSCVYVVLIFLFCMWVACHHSHIWAEVLHAPYAERSFDNPCLLCRPEKPIDAEPLTKNANNGVDVVVTSGQSEVAK